MGYFKKRWGGGAQLQVASGETLEDNVQKISLVI